GGGELVERMAPLVLRERLLRLGEVRPRQHFRGRREQHDRQQRGGHGANGSFSVEDGSSASSCARLGATAAGAARRLTGPGCFTTCGWNDAIFPTGIGPNCIGGAVVDGGATRAGDGPIALYACRAADSPRIASSAAAAATHSGQRRAGGAGSATRMGPTIAAS